MKLKELYKKEIAKKLQEKFGYKNINQIPKIKKVVINVGVGRHAKDKGYIENVIDTVTLISGQKPMKAKAKKSISAFKIREGMVVGVAVTLRGERMFDFLDKLINITFPRVRDFRGIESKIIDKTGNISIGFKEHLPFPEIQVDDVENVHGVEITISTTTKTKEEGFELFKLMNFPFKDSK